MIFIETDRLLIRNFTRADAAALRIVVVDKEASEYAAYDYEWPTSPEAICDIIERFADYDGFLAIWLKDQDRLIGFLSFDRSGSDEAPSFDLGYCLHSAFHGRGYAFEASFALIEYAFRELGASRINSGTGAPNAPSRRLLARLGFRKTREETLAFRKTPDGAPVEFTEYWFELTRDDWLEKHANGLVV